MSHEIVPPEVKSDEIRTEFVSANNLTFEVDKCGNGDKLAICLHGFPEHSFSWRYQLPLLASMGYEAWAPNLRGYGKSSRPPRVEDYRLDNLMADVGALIDAADKKEVVLVAHDWGAVIAWQFAIEKIRNLSHLIICNVPHPGPMQRVIKDSWEQKKKSWYVFFFQLPRLPEWLLGRDGAKPVAEAFRSSAVDKSRFPDEAVEVYRRNADQPGALTAMVNYYRALLRFRKPVPIDEIEKIEVPTLMLWGEDDVALTKESTYGTDEFVSDLQIRYLPRVSHWVQQEAPEACNAMIKAFLSGEPVPEAKWELKLVEPSSFADGSHDDA